MQKVEKMNILITLIYLITPIIEITMANIRRAGKILLIIFTVVAMSLIAINLCDHFSVAGLKLIKWYVSDFLPARDKDFKPQQNDTLFNDWIAYHYNPDYYMLLAQPWLKIPRFSMFFIIVAHCFVASAWMILAIPLIEFVLFTYNNGMLISIMFLMTCIAGCFYYCYTSRTCLPNEPLTEV